MDTKLRMKKGEARGTRILYRVKSVLSISFSQKTFKGCFCFYLCKMRTKSNQKERGKGKEKERAREGVEGERNGGLRKRDWEREWKRRDSFFHGKRMWAWGLKGDNHSAQEPAAKGFGRLQEAGVLGCKTSIACQALASSQTHVYHTGIWGWW